MYTIMLGKEKSCMYDLIYIRIHIQSDSDLTGRIDQLQKVTNSTLLSTHSRATPTYSIYTHAQTASCTHAPNLHTHEYTRIHTYTQPLHTHIYTQACTYCMFSQKLTSEQEYSAALEGYLLSIHPDKLVILLAYIYIYMYIL